MNVGYRTFLPDEDRAKERDLFKLCFPETAGTPTQDASHHAWKFETFPSTEPSYRYVATGGDELIGFYAAIPYTYSIEGTLYRCGMVCDVMTHPAHRGRGIFSAIGRFATQALGDEGLAFTTGYPIRPEVVPGHLRVGWKVVAKLPTYVRPLSARTFLPPLLRPVTPLIDWALYLFQSWTLSSPGGYSVQTLGRQEFFDRFGGEENGQGYSSFIEEWIASQANALVKSIDFLEWRTGTPGADYRFVLLWHDDNLVGMAIVRPSTLKSVETLAIIDFMVLPSHYDGSRALHLELRRLARALGKDAVACMISARWARHYKFHGSAYLKSPAVFSLIVKKLDDSIADSALFEAEKWHLCWIDSDDL